jgi:hypothetical protein
MSRLHVTHLGARRALTVLALAVLFVLLGHPAAHAASDLWGNVGPAPQLGSNGLFGKYPLGNYTLDQHFDVVSASLTGGVDVSGVPPLIAYFLASILWLATSFLANLLITLFAFAFSLDLVHGSEATGGAGALAPVSQAIHSIYSNVFGAPWLVLAITVAGLWAMWKSLLQRRHSETAGALALSLVYVVLALFFVAQPGTTIGSAAKWTNQMSAAFLSISNGGSATSGAQAKDDAANQLFDLLIFKPWVVLNFGGLEHCVVAGTGSGDDDPESAPVRPFSTNRSRDASLAHRLAQGTEVTADGKVCINNANKYASHFLRFSLGADGQDDRNAEYDALTDGDSSKLPDADTAKAGYRLGVADKPASDSMEEGGQYQRLLLALVLFFGELGAILLLGALSVGVILAQVLLLLMLAFAPVALVAAVIPGRGHAFFRGWLEKLAGYLLRKAAYSLILATLLAVSGALASATAALGWLMSFGLQSLFYWAVFLQRKALSESLIGIATGPSAPGREATLRVLGLYAGARVTGRALRPLRRGARAASAPRRLLGGFFGSRRDAPGGATTPRFGTSHRTAIGGDADAPARQSAGHGPTKSRSSEGDPRSADRATTTPPDRGAGSSGAEATKTERGRPAETQKRSGRGSRDAGKKPKEAGKKPKNADKKPSTEQKTRRVAGEPKPTPERTAEQRQAQARRADPKRASSDGDAGRQLSDELRAEREEITRNGESDSEPKDTTAGRPVRRSWRRRKGGRS